MLHRKHFQPHIGSQFKRGMDFWPAIDDGYYFDFGGYQDSVTRTALPDANYEDVHYNLVNGQLVSYTKDEYVRDAQGRPVTFGAYSQLCLYSEDPVNYTVNGSPVVVLSPANDTGPFNSVTVTDGGASWHRVIVWRTATSGEPTQTIYCRIYYKAGTSNSLYCIIANVTASTSGVYQGTIGSAAITSETAGTFSNLIDVQDTVLGCRVLTFNFTFNAGTTGDAITMGIGPFSTDGSNIIVLGADVFNTSTWRPHVPSSGSVISVSSTQYDYNGGSPRGPRFAMTDIPLAATALAADGQLEYRGTPLFSATDTAADGKIVTVNETGTLLAHTPEGEFESSDGTQAANKDVDYVKDTEYLVKVPYGDKAGADKQQVFVNGVSGDLVDFDGSFNPDTHLGIGGSAMPMAHSSLKIRKKAQW